MPDNNALHVAAEKGDLVEVQSQLGKFGINAEGEKYETALHKAAENGHTDVVKLLLSLNADMNICVSTLEMISVHLSCISPVPNIYYTPLVTCCHLS